MTMNGHDTKSVSDSTGTTKCALQMRCHNVSDCVGKHSTTSNSLPICDLAPQLESCYSRPPSTMPSAVDLPDVRIIDDMNHPITILHFNDVYNVDGLYETDGGISTFYTAIKQFFPCNPLILFSGDVFNPSPISHITKGRHMIHFLNALRIHTACLGNHDLDFGIDHFELLSQSTNFPWVISNMRDPKNASSPIGGASRYRIFYWQGHRVGIMGLAEKEWLDSLGSVFPEEVIYMDYVSVARELCEMMRLKKCDLIIALTHMRSHHDKRLATEVQDIDLILGGHDHEYYGVKRLGTTLLTKSGTDFREFTVLKIFPGVKKSERYCTIGYDYLNSPLEHFASEDRLGGAQFLPRFCEGSISEWECVSVFDSDYTPDPWMNQLIEKYSSQLKHLNHQILAINDCFLDTRFSTLRTEETNGGSWVANLMRVCMGTDIAFLNSGTLRSDCIFEPGPFLYGHLSKMLPMDEPLVSIKLNAHELREVMEVSFAHYPHKDGRFLQIAGFQAVFDSSRAPYNRVVSLNREKVHPDGSISYEPIPPDTVVTAVTKEYLKNGKDGYTILKNINTILCEKKYSSTLNLIYDSLCCHLQHPEKRTPSANNKFYTSHDTPLSNTDLGQCGLVWEDQYFHIRATKRNSIANIA